MPPLPAARQDVHRARAPYEAAAQCQERNGGGRAARGRGEGVWRRGGARRHRSVQLAAHMGPAGGWAIYADGPAAARHCGWHGSTPHYDWCAATVGPMGDGPQRRADATARGWARCISAAHIPTQAGVQSEPCAVAHRSRHELPEPRASAHGVGRQVEATHGSGSCSSSAPGPKFASGHAEFIA